MQDYIFTLAAVLAVSAPVSADENFAVSGAGTISCGKFIEHQDDKLAVELHNTWSQGFLSAMNLSDAQRGKKLVLLPDSATINAYTLKYCRENPLERPLAAVLRLYEELRSRSSNDTQKK